MIKLQIIWLLFCHFFADFILQSNKIALNKSKDNSILTTHCIIYGLTMMFASLDVIFGLLVGLIHFPVDYFTSRMTTKFHKNKDRRSFFLTVGLDQFIHTTTIILFLKIS